MSLVKEAERVKQERDDIRAEVARKERERRVEEERLRLEMAQDAADEEAEDVEEAMQHDAARKDKEERKEREKSHSRVISTAKSRSPDPPPPSSPTSPQHLMQTPKKRGGDAVVSPRDRSAVGVASAEKKRSEKRTTTPVNAPAFR